ncbi:MAG: 30S ribosomal protein S2 [Minisyncoccia bacterium]
MIDIKNIEINKNYIIDNEKLISSGLLYVHNKSKTHPRMYPYIINNRNGLGVIKPDVFNNFFSKTISILENYIKNQSLILFVGTTLGGKEAIKQLATEFNQHYVINRWLGGTLTNFNVIRKQIEYYSLLKEKKEKGNLNDLSKKEAAKWNKIFNQLEKKFDGLVNLNRLPDLLFIIDPLRHKIAIQEARRLHLPIMAIMDNNDNPFYIDYPIFANDHNRFGLNILIDNIIKILKNKND